MNPNFDYILGKPEDGVFGRWVEGSVRLTDEGYQISANLFTPAVRTCSEVSLDINRVFMASDFAAFLRLATTGYFETHNRVLGLYETSGLDPAAAAAIFAATSTWIDPWDHRSLALLQDLRSLGDKLEQVRKREMLSLALRDKEEGYVQKFWLHRSSLFLTRRP